MYGAAVRLVSVLGRNFKRALLAAGVALLLAPGAATAALAPLAEMEPFGAAAGSAGSVRRLAAAAPHRGWLVTISAGDGRQALSGTGAVSVASEIGVWRVSNRGLAAVRQALERAGLPASIEPDRIVRLAAASAPLPGADPFSLDERWDLIGARGLTPPDPLGAYRPTWLLDSGIDQAALFDVVDPATFTSVGAQKPRPDGSADGGEAFHGAAVASLMAAPANGVGIEGVWPSMRVTSFDISSGTGDPDELVESRIIQGLVAAGRARAPVINLSFSAAMPLEAEERAVAYAQARGALVVAAAGNVGDSVNDVEYPAAYPYVLAVGALTADGHHAVYSNHRSYVDLVAPGDVVATVVSGYTPTGCLAAGVGGAPSYCALRGTSFATPLVSAIASWVAVARPRLNTIQRGNLLRASAFDIGAPGRDPLFGYGRVDLRRALDRQAFPASRIPDDPLEPNEDVAIVDGEDGVAQPPLLPLRRRRRTLTASVRRPKDPIDVYRVATRPGERLQVSLRPRAGDVNLFAWNGRTRSVGWLRAASPRKDLLGSSRRPGRRLDSLGLVTESRGFVYLAIEIPRGSAGGAYALSVRRQSLAPAGPASVQPTGRSRLRLG